MHMQGDGGALEDRLLLFLDRVPLERIELELARIAPSCVPREMSLGEVIRTLGVAGIARLQDPIVDRSVVLASAGPESCALADLIESNPYGHNVAAAPCYTCCGGGYGPSYGGGGFAVEYPGGFAAPDPGRGYPDPGYGFAGGGGPGPGGGDGRRPGRAPVRYPALPGGGGRGGGGGELVTADRRAIVEAAHARAAAAAGGSSSFGGSASSSAALGAGPRDLGPSQYGASYSYSADERRAGRVGNRRNPWLEDLAGSVSSGTFEPEPEPAAAPSSSSSSSSSSTFTGWPGAVPFRPDAWDFGAGWYILQADDTFSGLAATYLGSPARWHEIWALQSYRYTEAPDPSSVKPGRPLVRIGERVVMPPEATARAKELYSTGAPRAPAIGGTGGTPKGKGHPLSTGAKVAIGVAVLGVVGVGAYALT